MYAHAYQSYIWNLVVSERVKLSATEPLVGDLVYAEADVADGEAADDEMRMLNMIQQNDKRADG